MEYPSEFGYLTGCLHQDIFLIVKSHEEIPAYIAESLLPWHVTVLRPYLTELLSSDVSDDQLLELWNQEKSDFYLLKGAHVRQLLKGVLQLMPEYPEG